MPDSIENIVEQIAAFAKVEEEARTNKEILMVIKWLEDSFDTTYVYDYSYLYITRESVVAFLNLLKPDEYVMCRGECRDAFWDKTDYIHYCYLNLGDGKILCLNIAENVGIVEEKLGSKKGYDSHQYKMSSSVIPDKGYVVRCCEGINRDGKPRNCVLLLTPSGKLIPGFNINGYAADDYSHLDGRRFNEVVNPISVDEIYRRYEEQFDVGSKNGSPKGIK